MRAVSVNLENSRQFNLREVIAIAGVSFLLILSSNVYSQATSRWLCSDCATLPKVRQIPKPQYPAEAKRDRITGKVILTVLVGELGNVIDVKLVSGDQVLARAAVDAAVKAQFEPARSVDESHRPVKSWAQITYNFVPPASGQKRSRKRRQ